MNVILTTLFGIEALTAEELISLGYPRRQLIIVTAKSADPGTDRIFFARRWGGCPAEYRCQDR